MSRRSSPQNDRMQLAMTLNNVLASPGFSGWTQGEPLNVQRLLYTPEGKPRLAILSIAHLSDRERMFFSLPSCSMKFSRGCGASPGRRVCGHCSTWTKVFGYPPTDRQSTVEDTVADAAQTGPGLRTGPGPRHTEPGSISTTRRSPTPERGSSGDCRPNATNCAFWTAWKELRRPPAPHSTARRSTAFSRASKAACF